MIVDEGDPHENAAPVIGLGIAIVVVPGVRHQVVHIPVSALVPLQNG